MESAFPRGDGRFTVLESDAEYELMCADIDAAVAQGWTQRLGDLYGVVRRRRRRGQPKLPGKRTVHVPKTCQVPRGYGTIKGKSWRLQVIKGRPITPHTKHVLKHISRTIARAHHVLLTSINNERASRMYTTQEYKVRLKQDLQRTLCELQRLVPELVLSDVCFVHRV